jgi:hypothetical protein
VGSAIFLAGVFLDSESDGFDELDGLFVVAALIVTGMDGALLLGDFFQKKGSATLRARLINGPPIPGGKLAFWELITPIKNPAP